MLHSYPSLRNSLSCDILVVGGGLAGALIAYQLSKEGYETVVIDKRDIGSGSTCANTAMVQYEMDEPLFELMKIAGKEAAIDMYQESLRAVHKLGQIVDELRIDCDFRKVHSVHTASKQRDVVGLQQELECRKRAGINVHWLSKNDVRTSYGIKCKGAILSETAACMDAFRMTHALMQTATEKFGLRVYDHCTLDSVLYGNNQVTATVEQCAQVVAKRIVYATGYETCELIDTREIGARLISTFACISEPIARLPAIFSETIFWDTDEPYFYMRTTPDKRLLIGGADEPFQNAELRDAMLDKKEGELVKSLKRKLPSVDFVADYTWAGTFGASKDSLPFVGPHPQFPHSYFVLGFGGNGITFTVMSMEIISDALAGRPNRFLNYFKFNR